MDDFLYVALPLYDNESYYKYSVALEGSSFRLQFLYNSKMQLYTLTLSTADDTVLVEGVGLVPNYPIMANYVIEGLSGYFLLIPKDNSGIEYYKLYPRNLGKYYELNYVYENNSTQP